VIHTVNAFNKPRLKQLKDLPKPKTMGRVLQMRMAEKRSRRNHLEQQPLGLASESAIKKRP